MLLKETFAAISIPKHKKADEIIIDNPFALNIVKSFIFFTSIIASTAVIEPKIITRGEERYDEKINAAAIPSIDERFVVSAA